MKLDNKTIKDYIKTQPNGEYATSICRNCHWYCTLPIGNVDEAEIVESCFRCCKSTKQRA